MTEQTTQDIAAPKGTAAASPPRKAGTARTRKKTKSDAVVALLRRPRGATLDEMMKATGWQSHSVRGFLAGTLKKKLGRAATSEVTDKGRVYRIAPEAE